MSPLGYTAKLTCLYAWTMQLIALTGGIASGKSTIAKKLNELGAYILDADALARDAVARGSVGLEKIVESFGNEILLPSGELDRAGLAQVVFNDPQALKTLNSIVHPAVKDLLDQRAKEIAKHDPEAIAVYDVPLLVEHANAKDWDHVIVASAPEEIRVKRLIEIRGMAEEEALARIKNQATEAERLAVADTVIDTAGSLESTLAQTEELWKALVGADAELGEKPV